MQMPGITERTIAVQAIGAMMKTTARELEIPIIETAQVSRAVESRKDKRPGLPDLMFGGEHDTDVGMALYRDEVYSPGIYPNLVEVIVIKDRLGGQLGTALAYRHPITGLYKNVNP